MALRQHLLLFFVTLLCLQCYAEAPEALKIAMPIDHFSNDSDVFFNRFWMNASYYKPGGPVFLLDKGEAGITSDDAAATLTEYLYPVGVMQLAQK